MLECLAPGQKMVFILILHDCLLLHVESDCDDHDVIVYSLNQDVYQLTGHICF